MPVRILPLFILVTFLSSAQPTTGFSFAHISDTHIGNATAAEDLRRTVADINSMDSLAFAVISGDITEYGSDEQLRLAKQILDSLTIPWYIVPGNHDMKWSASGGRSFSVVFGSENFAFRHGGYQFIGMHQGPRMRMGDAYWAPEDLRWFDSVAAASRLGEERTPLIFVTHYPADSGIANWRAMTERLRKFNTQLLLNGHWHTNKFDHFDGLPSFVGRSNLRAREEFGGYNIITVRTDSITASTRIPGRRTRPQWASVAVGERSFTPLSPVDHEAIDIGNATLRWKHVAPVSMTSAPAVYGDKIAAGYSDGSVVVRRLKDGKELLRFKVPGGVYSSPAMDDRSIIITSSDSTIASYALKNAKRQWSLRTSAAIVASPVIHNGTVYTGASDHVFRAIDLKSGTVRWSFDSLQGFVEARPTIVGGKVLIGAWDEHLYCLDEGTGALLWKWKGEKRGTLLSPAVCEPVVAHGKVFIVAPDRFMTALDVETGTVVWRTNRFQVRETIGISEDGERVYVRTMNDSLYALSARSAQPEAVWSLHAGIGYDINSAQIREKEGIVFFASDNGMLVVADGKSGALLRTMKIGSVIAHTPVPLSKNRVIFSNITGTMMDIQWK
ncbi:MAG: PQQ-binding-like beta-propeller repeat protein [Bacteroidetes bacterium]|nr:PQQ-binding-like beta-propeller repeat protein [Bacteroidota bacterium]